jgi:hypothetical protein
MMSDAERLDADDDREAGPTPEIIEAQRLIDDFLDQEMTPAGRDRLEELATGFPAVARLCAVSMHLASYLPLLMGAAGSVRLPNAGDLRSEADALDRGRSLDEAMILPAVQDDGDFEPALVKLTPTVATPRALPVPSVAGKNRRIWRRGATTTPMSCGSGPRTARSGSG